MIEFGDTRLPEHFWSKVDVNESTGCWEWSGSKGVDGYGLFAVQRRTKRAHRIAYQALVSDIPDGKLCDHLCRVRNCVRPDHIELVSHRENVSRGRVSQANRERFARMTHCARGHELSGSNLYRKPKTGRRECNECRRIKARERYARSKITRA